MFWLCLASALVFLAAAARVAARRLCAPRLPSPLVDAPATLALLPMRDEEANAAACVTSVLGQTSRARVRVIDDGSTDRTAAVVREIHPEGRLDVVAAGPLPSGWRGKVHALHVGLEGSAEPWVLLVDADSRPAPDLLARTHAAAAAHGLDGISIAGCQETRTAGEAVLVPAVFALLDALLGDWRRSSRGDGPPVASGTFLLVRRAALEAAGGFEAIRESTIDDVDLFRALRRAGFRTGFWRSQELLRIRMYDGLSRAIAGWRRSLGALFAERPAVAAASLLACWAPPALLAAALAAGALSAAALAWAAGAAGSALVRFTGRAALWPAFLHPLDSALLGYTLTLGLLDHRRRRLAPWKGREIRLAGPIGDAIAREAEGL